MIGHPCTALGDRSIDHGLRWGCACVGTTTMSDQSVHGFFGCGWESCKHGDMVVVWMGWTLEYTIYGCTGFFHEGHKCQLWSEGGNGVEWGLGRGVGVGVGSGARGLVGGGWGLGVGVGCGGGGWGWVGGGARGRMWAMGRTGLVPKWDRARGAGFIVKDPSGLDSDRWIPLRGGARIPRGL